LRSDPRIALLLPRAKGFPHRTVPVGRMADPYNQEIYGR